MFSGYQSARVRHGSPQPRQARWRPLFDPRHEPARRAGRVTLRRTRWVLGAWVVVAALVVLMNRGEQRKAAPATRKGPAAGAASHLAHAASAPRAADAAFVTPRAEP